MSTRPPSQSAHFRRKPDGPRIYGHRGARARAPDNTREAFSLAMNEGADGVELDVRVTADARLVIFHDAAIQVGRRHYAISQLSLGQMAELLGRAPLCLSDVLDFRQETSAQLNVELKGDVPQRKWLAEATCRLLRERGTHDILISSFHPDLLWHVHRLLPEVPTALLLAQSRPLRPHLLCSLLHHLHASALHPQVGMVTPNLVREMQRRDLLVNVWTVNDPADFIRLAALGVDGIITDTPREARSALFP